MSERIVPNCDDCKNIATNKCLPCGHYSNFERKEKEMEKIQMTENEAHKHYIDVLPLDEFDSHKLAEDMIIIAKEKGYIKKSDLEIMAQEYETALHSKEYTKGETLNAAKRYINELKKELEEKS